MVWWSVGVVDWVEGEGFRVKDEYKNEGFYRREENYLTEFGLYFGSMWILNVKITT